MLCVTLCVLLFHDPAGLLLTCVYHHPEVELLILISTALHAGIRKENCPHLFTYIPLLARPLSWHAPASATALVKLSLIKTSSARKKIEFNLDLLSNSNHCVAPRMPAKLCRDLNWDEETRWAAEGRQEQLSEESLALTVWNHSPKV